MSCTTSALAGYGGSITGLAGTTEIKSWNMNIVNDILDATSLGSGWRENIVGLSGGNGQFVAIGSCALTTTTYAGVAFKVSNSGKTLTCDIKVSNANVVDEVDGIITYTVDFTVCGAIVES